MNSEKSDIDSLDTAEIKRLLFLDRIVEDRTQAT